MVSFFKSGDVSAAVRNEMIREMEEIKALLTGQPLRTDPDHSRQLDELKSLLINFKPE